MVSGAWAWQIRLLFFKGCGCDMRTHNGGQPCLCRPLAPPLPLKVRGGRQAPSYIIGYWLSEWLGLGYIAVSMVLGAVGSFFSVRKREMEREGGLHREKGVDGLGWWTHQTAGRMRSEPHIHPPLPARDAAWGALATTGIGSNQQPDVWRSPASGSLKAGAQPSGDGAAADSWRRVWPGGAPWGVGGCDAHHLCARQ